MYKCDDCDFIFETPKTAEETVDGWLIDRYPVCPECFSYSIIETVPCEQCSEQHESNGEKYCGHCKSEVDKEISAAVDDLKSRWDSELVNDALTRWVEMN